MQRRGRLPTRARSAGSLVSGSASRLVEGRGRHGRPAHRRAAAAPTADPEAGAAAHRRRCRRGGLTAARSLRGSRAVRYARSIFLRWATSCREARRCDPSTRQVRRHHRIRVIRSAGAAAPTDPLRTGGPSPCHGTSRPEVTAKADRLGANGNPKGTAPGRLVTCRVSDAASESVTAKSDQEREVRERQRVRGPAPGTTLYRECIRLTGRGLTAPEVTDHARRQRRHRAWCSPPLCGGRVRRAEDAPRPGARPRSPVRTARRWSPCWKSPPGRAARGLPPRCATAWPRNGFPPGRVPVETDPGHAAAQGRPPVLQQAARAQLEDLRLYGWARVRV